VPAAVRLLVHAVALVAGAAAGLIGSFKFSYARGDLPVGLAVTLAMSFAVFVSAGLVARSRGAALSAAAGWLVVVGVLSMQRPEGDLVVPATGPGYAWLLGGTVVAGLGIALPYGPPGGHPASGAPRTRR
jgi:hypothetical protein